MSDFTVLQQDRANNLCIDCGRKNCHWASVNNGVYMCLDCSGKHRSLGVHISFVRSITMDGWSELQMKLMEHGGNTLFSQMVQEYGLNALDTPARYNTVAATWYRQALRAKAEASHLPVPPSLAEGLEQVLYHRPLNTATPQSAQSTEETKEGGWLGSVWSTATDWANKAKDKGLVETVKGAYGKSWEVGNSLYGKSWELGGKLYDKSMEVGHAVVNKSMEVGHAVVDKSVEVGHAVVDKSVEVGHSLYDRSSELMPEAPVQGQEDSLDAMLEELGPPPQKNLKSD